MKLLALIHRLPCPPDRGAKLRAAAELRWLTARHDVWCAGFVDPPGPGESAEIVNDSLDELRARCRHLAAVDLHPTMASARAAIGLLSGGTATEAYFASRELRRQVMRWTREVRFDAVLAFSSSMAPLALQVPARRRVLDLVDLDSRKWFESAPQARRPMAWVYRAEAQRLGQRECEWIRAFDASVLCTQREKDLIADRGLRGKMHVIETGASQGTEVFATDDGSAETAHASLTHEPVVGFVGAMDYPPNVDGVRWFAEAIWPQVLEHCPDARWWIVGRSPSRAVRNLADGHRVRVTGTVPRVEPYLAGMRVNVAPLRLARGIQTKVLTAMRAGIPCVVTPCVAAGIGAEANREMLVASSPVSFTEAVVHLLGDHAAAATMGKAGRCFVLEQYRAADGLERLESLLATETAVGETL